MRVKEHPSSVTATTKITITLTIITTTHVIATTVTSNNSNKIMLCPLPQQIANLVSVVCPLRDVQSVERVDSVKGNATVKRALFICTTQSSSTNSFLFIDVGDRDFVINKLSEMLGKSIPTKK